MLSGTGADTHFGTRTARERRDWNGSVSEARRLGARAVTTDLGSGSFVVCCANSAALLSVAITERL